ncbi:unnamed protein product [Rotaria sp. Silwood2]|nr:unnamed protein product [Rotaria sp. Silwood2]
MISRNHFNGLIIITLIINLLFVNDQHSQYRKWYDQLMNMHMLKCYKNNINQTVDTISPEYAYYMDGNLLCKVYNESSSYRRCLYSIFENDNNCYPSSFNQQILNKCNYSFVEKFSTKCREFLRSLICLERYEMELIPSTYGSVCSRNKAYYYYYGDVAARLQLAINICEINFTF